VTDLQQIAFELHRLRIAADALMVIAAFHVIRLTIAFLVRGDRE
jgi:hypothetical protein